MLMDHKNRRIKRYINIQGLMQYSIREGVTKTEISLHCFTGPYCIHW